MTKPNVFTLKKKHLLNQSNLNENSEHLGHDTVRAGLAHKRSYSNTTRLFTFSRILCAKRLHYFVTEGSHSLHCKEQ